MSLSLPIWVQTGLAEISPTRRLNDIFKNAFLQTQEGERNFSYPYYYDLLESPPALKERLATKLESLKIHHVNVVIDTTLETTLIHLGLEEVEAETGDEDSETQPRFMTVNVLNITFPNQTTKLSVRQVFRAVGLSTENLEMPSAPKTPTATVVIEPPAPDYRPPHNNPRSLQRSTEVRPVGEKR